MKVECPTCKKTYDLSRYPPGKKVRCGKCGTVLTPGEPSKRKGRDQASKDPAEEEDKVPATRKVPRTQILRPENLLSTIKISAEELAAKKKGKK